MQRRYHVTAVAVLAALIGCRQESTTPSAVSPETVVDHDHHTASPHGGTVVDWGGGVYHVEFTVDHDARSATVYVLDDDAISAASVKAEKLLLTISEPAFQLDLAANPQPGDASGTSSRFTGVHESLGLIREFAGTISGEVDGVPYAGDFQEGNDHHHDG